MNHVERARELFVSGCSCSQAVFAAFAPELGIEHDTALKLASSFGGGLGGSRELCGAVSGMLMVAGMKWGYTQVLDNAVKTAHYARTRALIDAFRAEHETIVCRDLLKGIGKISKDPSQRTEQYYKVRPCVRFVETAAALLENMMESENNPQ